MSSIKKNFLYSSILTTSNYIFPLLTYPYVSRVLGVTNIGLFNFADSIINYFVLFSAMGISTIGLREIAGSKGDKSVMNKTFSNLFVLNSLLTLLALFILVVCICIIPDLQDNKGLMFVGVLKLVSNLFLVDWFYKGLEKFKYITNVTLIVKILYVISVFLLVKEQDDYTMYYLLCTLMITFNAIANFIYAFKYVRFDFAALELFKYMKPNFILGIYYFLISMYTSFNVAYLGFVSSTTEVGYYSTGVKLFSIIIAIYTAFTGVVQPRMSALLSENRYDDFISLIRKSTDLLFTVTIPSVIITVLFTPEIINIISGNGYEGAILPTRIVMPLIFIIGYEQILVIQVLSPMKKDNQILINSLIGATIGLILNITLVYKFASVGSAIAWVLSEISVLVSAQYFVKKNIGIGFPIQKLLKEILLYLPIIIIIYLIVRYSFLNDLLTFFICTFLIVIYFILVKRKFVKLLLFSNR